MVVAAGNNNADACNYSPADAGGKTIGRLAEERPAPVEGRRFQPRPAGVQKTAERLQRRRVGDIAGVVQGAFHDVKIVMRAQKVGQAVGLIHRGGDHR